MSYTPRLKKQYASEISAALKKTLGVKSDMRVPRLEKIVLSQGLGEAVADKKVIDSAMGDMALIAGQKPIAKLSKKDISNFKLRKGMPIGVMVTLRGDKMYEFLDRFINIALPRTRDFRGISAKSFDGRGNFNMGIKEHIIFPEIDIDKVNKILGMDITFVTSTDSDEEGKALLEAFNFPFIKIDEKAEAAKAAKKEEDRLEREEARLANADDEEGEGGEGAPEAKAKTEDAPAAEAKTEDAPAAEAKTDDAPAAEAPAAEAKPEEAPAAEAKPEEAPAAEAATEDAPATEEAPAAEEAKDDASASDSAPAAEEGNDDKNENESAE